MNELQQIEMVLRTEVPLILNNLEWIEAHFSGIFFKSGGGPSLTYLSSLGQVLNVTELDRFGEVWSKKIPSDDILYTLLREKYLADIGNVETRWNKVDFVLFPNGQFKYSLSWDELAERKHEIALVETFVESMGQEIYADIANNGLLASVDSTTQILGRIQVVNEVTTASYVLKTSTTESHYELSLDHFWEEKTLEVYETTNFGFLKGFWPAWNIILYNLPVRSQEFDIEKHVTYQFE
ncbi:hypothetical protein [uncultured Fibrella sp.]|uniref:hypothetical protein n=1 Tax=uncultured Fibrella sp. TaxID=1284596 RepID=UPI0035CC8B92